jgi:hypothetical protein
MSRSTQQKMFHNFLTSIHFPMDFWIKLNQFESIQINSEKIGKALNRAGFSQRTTATQLAMLARLWDSVGPKATGQHWAGPQDPARVPHNLQVRAHGDQSGEATGSEPANGAARTSKTTISTVWGTR